MVVTRTRRRGDQGRRWVLQVVIYYDGEVLDGAQFGRRYGDREVPEYVVRIDGDAYIEIN